MDERIGKYVINQALAGATIVSGASGYTEASFWIDLATARVQLADTAARANGGSGTSVRRRAGGRKD